MELPHGIVSYNSYDYERVKCVPVIASFDSDGHIMPLYVRINGQPFKVDSYWVKNTFTKYDFEFNCKVTDGERLIPLALTYHQAERVWTIPDRE